MKFPILLFPIAILLLCFSAKGTESYIPICECDSTGTNSNIPNMGWDSTTNIGTTKKEPIKTKSLSVSGTPTNDKNKIFINGKKKYLKK